mmetsp:Transcript_10060/g.11162  ORF Transcript_10060/g.11162 Transcript_10060/m.11162 type:complete len:564 (+) Transcript_10060:199-1890(+)
MQQTFLIAYTLILLISGANSVTITTNLNGPCGNDITCYIEGETNITEIVLGPFNHTAQSLTRYSMTDNIVIRSDSPQSITCADITYSIEFTANAYEMTFTNILFERCRLTIANVGDVNIQNCSFTGAPNGQRPALSISIGKVISIDNTVFVDNQLVSAFVSTGSAFRATTINTIIMTDTQFRNNCILKPRNEAQGGAVHINGATRLVIDRCLFVDDKIDSDSIADIRGGAIFIVASETTIRNSVFRENTAVATNDGKRIGGKGCAVYVEQLSTYESVVFSNNCPGQYDERAEGTAIYSAHRVVLRNTALKESTNGPDVFCVGDKSDLKLEGTVLYCDGVPINTNCPIIGDTSKCDCNNTLCCTIPKDTPFDPKYSTCPDVVLSHAPIRQVARVCTNCSCLVCPADILLNNTSNRIDVVMNDGSWVKKDTVAIITKDVDNPEYYFEGCFTNLTTGTFHVDVQQVNPNIHDSLPQILLLCENPQVQLENSHRCHTSTSQISEKVLIVKFDENGKCNTNNFPLAIIITMVALIVLAAVLAGIACAVPKIRSSISANEEVTQSDHSE